MNYPSLAVGLVVILVSVACIEVPVEVQVTAEPRPADLQGARWQSLPLHYCLAHDPEAFVDKARFERLAAEAFAAWNIDVRSDGECRQGVTPRDGINQVGWGRPAEASTGTHEAGFTRIVFQECPSGCAGAASRIIEADIIIAKDPPRRWQTSQCLASVLLHETGHFLGLPHLDSPAIMAAASSTCKTELTGADRAALEALYGGLQQ